jgi:allophanate hydrolase
MRFADLLDPLSRPLPGLPPPGVADRMRVLAVPRDRLDLDPEHAWAWERALAHAAGIARLVPVDIEPFLAAGRLLYQGPWVAERWSAFGHLLAGPGVDPTVRTIVSAGRDVTGSDVFAGLDRLAALRRFTAPVWTEVDALLLPVTPGHPTLAAVAADPIGVNGRLGTYTTFGNLLDLCAIAVPAGRRDDNLPFGVQLIAPAFADAPLLDLAARWCAEPELLAPLPPGWTLLAVCGAHLSGLPLNPHLLRQGGRLRHRARTGPGYRLFRLPGDGIARAGLVHTGDGPDDGIAVEVWALPHQGVGALLDSVPPPLGFGPITLDDNTVVSGFLAGAGAGGSSEDISGYGGWRAYLASRD